MNAAPETNVHRLTSEEAERRLEASDKRLLVGLQIKAEEAAAAKLTASANKLREEAELERAKNAVEIRRLELEAELRRLEITAQERKEEAARAERQAEADRIANAELLKEQSKLWPTLKAYIVARIRERERLREENRQMRIAQSIKDEQRAEAYATQRKAERQQRIEANRQFRADARAWVATFLPRRKTQGVITQETADQIANARENDAARRAGEIAEAKKEYTLAKIAGTAPSRPWLSRILGGLFDKSPKSVAVTTAVNANAQEVIEPSAQLQDQNSARITTIDDRIEHILSHVKDMGRTGTPMEPQDVSRLSAKIAALEYHMAAAMTSTRGWGRTAISVASFGYQTDKLWKPVLGIAAGLTIESMAFAGALTKFGFLIGIQESIGPIGAGVGAVLLSSGSMLMLNAMDNPYFRRTIMTGVALACFGAASISSAGDRAQPIRVAIGNMVQIFSPAPEKSPELIAKLQANAEKSAEGKARIAYAQQQLIIAQKEFTAKDNDKRNLLITDPRDPTGKAKILEDTLAAQNLMAAQKELKALELASTGSAATADANTKFLEQDHSIKLAKHQQWLESWGLGGATAFLGTLVTLAMISVNNSMRKLSDIPKSALDKTQETLATRKAMRALVKAQRKSNAALKSSMPPHVEKVVLAYLGELEKFNPEAALQMRDYLADPALKAMILRDATIAARTMIGHGPSVGTQRRYETERFWQVKPGFLKSMFSRKKSPAYDLPDRPQGGWTRSGQTPGTAVNTANI